MFGRVATYISLHAEIASENDVRSFQDSLQELVKFRAAVGDEAWETSVSPLVRRVWRIDRALGLSPRPFRP